MRSWSERRAWRCGEEESVTGRLFLIEILQLADGPIRGRRRSSADKSIDSAGSIDERDTAGRLADLRGFFSSSGYLGTVTAMVLSGVCVLKPPDKPRQCDIDKTGDRRAKTAPTRRASCSRETEPALGA